jgi:hypothetical protein
MAQKLKTVLSSSIQAVATIYFCSTLSFAQQSSLQTSFLAPAAVRTPALAIADIADTEHLSYLKQVEKEQHKISGLFQPNASDLLIQKAEDRFRTGRKFYQDQDFDQARSEFDTVIDLMLQASGNPTSHSLYESRLEDLVDSIHRYDLTSLGAAVQETEPQFDKVPLEDIVQTTFPVDPRIKEKVRTEIQTTSSALPLVMNDVVLGYINYFNGRGHKTLEYGLARAGKYRPMISKILAEEGVPQELIHLAQAESGLPASRRFPRRRRRHVAVRKISRQPVWPDADCEFRRSLRSRKGHEGCGATSERPL